MTLVKTTIKSGNKTYISVDLPGHGSANNNFNVAKTTLQLTFDNFPAFNGTEEEWKDVMLSTTEIKTEIVGSH